MYGGLYKIHGTDTYFKPRLRTNHASAWKSETCFGFSMESGSWDVFKLKRKAKNKIQAAVLIRATQYEYGKTPCGRYKTKFRGYGMGIRVLLRY